MRKVLSALVTAVALPVAGLAQELDYWGAAGAWEVMIDPALGNGCLIQTVQDDGSVVRIGFDRDQAAGYVTAVSPVWAGVVPGMAYDIEYDLDGAAQRGRARGIFVEGAPAVDILFDNPEFLFVIAGHRRMSLRSAAGAVMQIDLGGVQAGLEAMLACQNDIG